MNKVFLKLIDQERYCFPLVYAMEGSEDIEGIRQRLLSVVVQGFSIEGCLGHVALLLKPSESLKFVGTDRDTAEEWIEIRIESDAVLGRYVEITIKTKEKEWRENIRPKARITFVYKGKKRVLTNFVSDSDKGILGGVEFSDENPEGQWKNFKFNRMESDIVFVPAGRAL